MKKKEPVGDESEAVPADVLDELDAVTPEKLRVSFKISGNAILLGGWGGGGAFFSHIRSSINDITDLMEILEGLEIFEGHTAHNLGQHISNHVFFFFPILHYSTSI